MARFIADSSSDIFHMEGVDFISVPLTISTDLKDYIDDKNLDVQGMTRDLSEYKGKSCTACPSIERWLDAFEGADVIYVGTLTSTLSGTYNSALVAKEMYEQVHPNVKIHVFDTLSAGPELLLLMEKLVELDKEGKSFEEVVTFGETYLKQTRLFFALKSLHNLVQNGRVSKVVATAAGALGISVLGTASVEGTLEPFAKCRGEKKVIATFLEEIQRIGFRKGKVRINHVENHSLAEKLKVMIEEKYPGSDVCMYEARGLCSYYAERGGILVGVEGNC